MTNREKIDILRELQMWPISTVDEKLEQVTEALEWAIKICEKFEERRVVRNEMMEDVYERVKGDL